MESEHPKLISLKMIRRLASRLRAAKFDHALYHCNQQHHCQRKNRHRDQGG